MDLPEVCACGVLWIHMWMRLPRTVLHIIWCHQTSSTKKHKLKIVKNLKKASEEYKTKHWILGCFWTRALGSFISDLLLKSTLNETVGDDWMGTSKTYKTRCRFWDEVQKEKSIRQKQMWNQIAWHRGGWITNTIERWRGLQRLVTNDYLVAQRWDLG